MPPRKIDPRLHWRAEPTWEDQTRLVLAFSGWMDGGQAATGVLDFWTRTYAPTPLAEIAPADFYLENLPGSSMELSALFRPHVKMADGLIESLTRPVNQFSVVESEKLVLFAGAEPHLHWDAFADLMLQVCRRAHVHDIYFLGTFAGATPHTRQPRFYGSVSNAALKPGLEKLGLRWSDYEGPASFATYFMTRAAEKKLPMVNIVAEIPGYISGPNPMAIEAMTRQATLALSLTTDLASLRHDSNEWENHVTDLVAKDDKLARKIRQLEEQYDDQLIRENEGG